MQRAEEARRAEEEEAARRRRQEESARQQREYEEAMRQQREAQARRPFRPVRHAHAGALWQAQSYSMPSYPSYAPAPAPVRESHGGTWTGRYHESSGSAAGRPVFQGARGGVYHLSASGNKVYHKK